MPPVVAPQASASATTTADPNSYSHTGGSVNEHTLAPRTPLLPTTINLSPPTVPRPPTVTPNYQTRWEREKTKARAEGDDIEGNDPKMIGPWVMGEMLGRGASGRVRLARHFSTGKMAAVKILNLHPNLSSRSSTLASAGEKAEKMMLTAEREIAVMKLLDHPNIMKMYDVWSSAKYLYLVLEYVQGGELFDYLCGRGTRLPLLEAISIIKQVLAGVNYCHTFSICHRDLKPENILLTTETVGSSSKPTEIKRVKIADFGMSTLDTLNGLLRTSCGSPHYAAPEIVRGQTYSGATSDIWSCGVIFFALLTSRLPFDDPQVSNVLRKVRDGRFTVPEYVVGPTKDLLVRMLEVDIEKRITMSEIFRHPLLQMDTPGITLPPAPKVDDIALPVAAEDVDPDLLRNLCIIWRERGQEHMMNRLSSVEKNFAKAFYFLLCRYRDRSFEEYNMDPMGISSHSMPHTPATTTSTSMDSPADTIPSPIRRHYPGRVSPHVLALTKKASLNQQSNAANTGSPIKQNPSVDGRENATRRSSVSKVRSATDRRVSITSPNTSPVKYKAIAATNVKPESPRKSRILSETSATANGSPRSSRVSSHKSILTSADNRKRSGSGSSKSSVHRASKPESNGALPKNAMPIRRSSIPTSVRNEPQSQTKTPSIGSATRNRMVGGQVSKTATIHRRATSASGAIPSSWGPGRRVKGQEGSIVPEDKGKESAMVDSSTKATGTLNAAPAVPRGIVNHRRSLITGQIKSSQQVSRKENLNSTPAPATAAATTSVPIQDNPEARMHTPIAKRLTSPTPQPPPRPLSKVMSPARYGPPSVGVNSKAYSLPPPGANPVNRTSLPSREVYSGSGGSSPYKLVSMQPASTPTKKTTLSSILESDNLHLSGPIELKGTGLGVFVSPVSKTQSTKPMRTQGPGVASPKLDPGSSPMVKQHRRHLDGEPISRQLPVVASRTNESPRSREGRNSGSSEDAWEKLDMLPDTSNSGDMNTREGGKDKKVKKRPAPLDLLNPHVSNRRLHPNNNGINIPKSMPSPLLSPFLGFWGGNPSTPTTPSLAMSPATPTTAGSNMMSYANSGGGRGLFARLFDWKSPNLRLVSSESAFTTREECARILREMKVTFAPSDSGGFKCRMDDVTDPQGIRVNKAVRFRIEFRPVTPSTSSTPYLTNSLSSNSYNERSSASASYSHWNTQIVATASPRPVSTVGSDQRQYTKKHGESNGSSNSEASMACALVFVQEKGAYSALKSIHQAMKNMWKLDLSGTAEGAHSTIA